MCIYEVRKPRKFYCINIQNKDFKLEYLSSKQKPLTPYKIQNYSLEDQQYKNKVITISITVIDLPFKTNHSNQLILYTIHNFSICRKK